MKYTILVVPLFVVSYFPSESTGWGCPHDVRAMRKLNLDKFLGTWYEYWYHNRVYDTPGRCTTMEFARNQLHPEVINITVTDRVKYNEVENTGKLWKYYNKDTSGEYKLAYYFRTRSFFRRRLIIEYSTGVFKVLGMSEDEDCWAVVYSCLEHGLFKHEYVSVLLKTRDSKCVTKKQRSVIEKVLEEADLDIKSMEVTDQVGCNHVEPPA